MAVNLGNDSDTAAAIYEQLAGAFYGEIGIPTRWLSILAHIEKIIETADEIYRLSRTTNCDVCICNIIYFSFGIITFRFV